MPAITFRRIGARELPVLLEWLGRPHVAEWWGEHPSIAELEAEYAPVTARDDLTAYFAMLDGAPIGFIQSYIAKDAGDGWWPDVRDPGVRGIDQFLADAEQLGRGIGTEMVRAFVHLLFTDPAVTLIQTDPSPANGRAIRCYEKAGFRAVSEVDTPDGRALLMHWNREAQSLG